MKFVLEIQCGNEAFEGVRLGPELARVLRSIADRVEHAREGDPRLKVPSGAYDINGNSCASFRMVEQGFDPDRDGARLP